MITFIFYLVMIISILISVAFLTLLERKILGYIHIRKGPNSISLTGILQPISDAIKLFSKEISLLNLSNRLTFLIAPTMSIILSLFIWLLIPMKWNPMNFNFALMFFLCITSTSVYFLMVAGWSSNSKYSLLGTLRAVAQTISYEVSLALILLSIIFMSESYNLMIIDQSQLFIWNLLILFPLFICWFSSILAETNRAPFDFAESESELVSGFNTEYSSGSFAMIFMAEYSSILMMSMITTLIFFGSNINFTSMMMIKTTIISFIFIWIRGSYPRFRYDKLMFLTWKIFLPISLGILMIILNYKIIQMW
uniref:NADH-ubiquinone oxidoreductase chain 1 n=1 Tax=Epiperipatus biolleyi TaxID=172520 RepID=A3QU29_EPIBI|nr:NADH dehydrogenase subunit 1 [Epiperipatus biolleyi]ABF93299.1 NADH dehydrogenase subunit 1 [Epiperipatus biolleyi]